MPTPASLRYTCATNATTPGKSLHHTAKHASLRCTRIPNATMHPSQPDDYTALHHSSSPANDIRRHPI
ncbi:hypothetical protein Pcinc_005751 [Petrolisthes cinctipes]|uniref:Uncharacterized protein n=1 Tax=Petrolisthes cinctipes TaxID=88211 RepID=A0AAE1GE29_PETCI|nr:hypothetical protein Pcinc_005751 [Petrolisthes cinctipes]